MRKTNTRKRLILSISVLLAGAILLIYGLTGHSIAVDKKGKISGEDTLTLSESAVVKDATVGGVVRSETGSVQRTYGDNEKPAAACPT